jgi:hypothetical protein
MAKKLMRIEAVCRGMSPLLMSRFEDPEKDGTCCTVDPRELVEVLENSPESLRRRAERLLYRKRDGRLFLPAQTLVGALERAAALVPAAVGALADDGLPPVRVRGKDLILWVPNADRPWEVDVQHTPLPAGADRVTSARPRFDSWGFTAQLAFRPEAVSENRVRKLLDKAGKLVGLGAFSPAFQGSFGKFRVREWKQI